MQTLQIQFKGIQRQLPYQNNPDGVLDELINLRHYKGRLEPVGLKPISWTISSNNEYIAGWVHEMDSETNWIGQDSANQLVLIKSGETVSETLIKAYGDGGRVKVEFLNRFMVVVYDGGMDRFVWKDGVYSPVTAVSRPLVYFNADGTKLYTADEGLGASSVLGEYFAKVNEASRENFHTGGIMLRAALRMFDGSYVVHSIPEYLNLGLQMLMTERQVEGGGEDNDPNQIKFYASQIKAILVKSDYAYNKELYTHLVIFACKNESLYEMDEEVLTDDLILDKVKSTGTGNFTVNFSSIYSEIGVNPDFEKMADSASWYKIHEELISEIQDGDATQEIIIDMKQFYQDYATRETLPVDSFSHHELAANITYDFNSRLHLCDITTKFGNYDYTPLSLSDSTLEPGSGVDGDYEIDSLKNCKFLVTLETDSGTIQKVVDIGQMYFWNQISTGLKYIVISKSVIGYPDARATKIELLIEEAGQWFKDGVWMLKKSTFDNYAYYHDEDFTVADYDSFDTNTNFPKIIHSPAYTTVFNMAAERVESARDGNRAQISQLNNPFFFPAENSYQVGTGVITGIAANTEPLSVSQFGQHPLMIFSSKGLWALVQGQGSVLYSNAIPVSGDVATPGSIVAISKGVVFATSKGLFLTNGGDMPTELTSLATGLPNADFQPNRNYQHHIENNKLVQLSACLSTVDILEYLTGANIGYDHVNKELVVSNPNYSYSYLYGFESGMWFKIDFSVKLLVNYYPKLFAFKELVLNNVVVETRIINLSDETKTNIWKDVLLTSQPMMFGSESFKVIRRVILRTIHETQEGVFNSGFYIFGSSDLINWQRVTGRNHISGRKRDILLQRSGSKFKYFIFVFAAKLKVVGSYIADLQVSFDYKANNKLR